MGNVRDATGMCTTSLEKENINMCGSIWGRNSTLFC